MRRLLMLGALALTGCVTVTPTYSPQGQEAYTITCNGYARSWGTCYERAGDVCGPRGYTVLAQNEEHGMIAQAGSYLATAVPLIGRSLMVACGR